MRLLGLSLLWVVVVVVVEVEGVVWDSLGLVGEGWDRGCHRVVVGLIIISSNSCLCSLSSRSSSNSCNNSSHRRLNPNRLAVWAPGYLGP